MTCPKCNKEVDSLTKDHIVPKLLMNPLRKIFRIGIGSDESHLNLRMICKDCNISKGHKLDYSEKYTNDTLYKLYLILKEKYENTNTTS